MWLRFWPWSHLSIQVCSRFVMFTVTPAAFITAALALIAGRSIVTGTGCPEAARFGVGQPLQEKGFLGLHGFEEVSKLGGRYGELLRMALARSA